MSERHSAVQQFSTIFFASIKPAVYLLLVFAILAIIAGVLVSFLGEPFLSMAAWFVIMCGVTVGLLVALYRYRQRVLHVDEQPAEFMEATLFSLLGIVGAGPFAAALLDSQSKFGGGLHIQDPVVIVALLSAFLFCAAAWKMIRLLTRP